MTTGPQTRRPMPSQPESQPQLDEIPALGTPAYMAWLTGKMIAIDSRGKRLEETVGESPDQLRDKPGSGMLAVLAQLQEDRRFYRIMSSTIAAVVTVVEVVRLVYSLGN